MANQKCILGLHYNEVTNSKQRDGCPIFLENDIIAGIERGNWAVRGVSLFVLLKIIRHCSPASDVVPIEAGLHYEDAIRLFHDRVIERDAWQFTEALTQSLLEILRSPNLGNEISQLRRVTVEFAEHCRHGPDEHSRVPAEISFSQKRFGQVQVWFFAKAQYAMDRIDVGALAQTDWLALLDVAESGARPRGFDADGHKPASLLGCVGSQGQRFLKSRSVCNHMIGRENDHDCCVIANCHPAGPKRDRGSGIAFGRLGDDIFLWKIA